jgi:hypothetical protein
MDEDCEIEGSLERWIVSRMHGDEMERLGKLERSDLVMFTTVDMQP